MNRPQYLANPEFRFFEGGPTLIISWIFPIIPDEYVDQLSLAWRKAAPPVTVIGMN